MTDCFIDHEGHSYDQLPYRRHTSPVPDREDDGSMINVPIPDLRYQRLLRADVRVHV